MHRGQVDTNYKDEIQFIVYIYSGSVSHAPVLGVEDQFNVPFLCFFTYPDHIRMKLT